ncbi:hypothetical protein, partial [Brachybacterium sp. AOP29-B2-41]|uniref:hypothetical protein n=1 Tax=Brachybacterium sp. AOP29-B2-41 TaxID=3457704 RepID=UPI0040345178
SRTLAAVAALDHAVEKARETGDEQAELNAMAVRTARGKELFEGGKATLEQWTQPVLFGGGTAASRAIAEKASRQGGLGFIALGVALGAVASILSLWFLPA